MEYVTLAKVVSTHGIKGEVKILSDFEYKDTKFVIEKNNEGKWIVSSYILHE